MIGRRVLKVYLLVRHIKVSAHNHRLGKGRQVCPEGIFPLHTVVQTAQPVLGIGDIDANQEKILVLQGNHPPLPVVFLYAQAITHGKRRMFGIDSRTGVAFLFRVVPIGLIAQELQIQLTGLQFGFLQTEKVCVQLRKDIGKTLAGHGPQAVHIPGDKFHTIPKSRWRLPWCP